MTPSLRVACGGIRATLTISVVSLSGNLRKGRMGDYPAYAHRSLVRTSTLLGVDSPQYVPCVFNLSATLAAMLIDIL